MSSERFLKLSSSFPNPSTCIGIFYSLEKQVARFTRPSHLKDLERDTRCRKQVTYNISRFGFFHNFSVEKSDV